MSRGAVCRRMQEPAWSECEYSHVSQQQRSVGHPIHIYNRPKSAARAGGPGVGGGEVFAFAKFAHCFRLMGSDLKIGAWLGGAEQDETGIAIGGIILLGIGLIYFTALQARRAGQAVSLVTHGGQNYACFESGVPDVLVAAYLDGARLAVVQQLDLKHVRFRHSFTVVLHGRKDQVGAGANSHVSQRRETWGTPFSCTFMDCRKLHSCCTGRGRALLGGSARRGYSCRRARAPAVR
jgi:hypothetical protein